MTEIKKIRFDFECNKYIAKVDDKFEDGYYISVYYKESNEFIKTYTVFFEDDENKAKQRAIEKIVNESGKV